MALRNFFFPSVWLLARCFKIFCRVWIKFPEKIGQVLGSGPIRFVQIQIQELFKACWHCADTAWQWQLYKLVTWYCTTSCVYFVKMSLIPPQCKLQTSDIGHWNAIVFFLHPNRVFQPPKYWICIFLWPLDITFTIAITINVVLYENQMIPRQLRTSDHRQQAARAVESWKTYSPLPGSIESQRVHLTI